MRKTCLIVTSQPKFWKIWDSNVVSIDDNIEIVVATSIEIAIMLLEKETFSFAVVDNTMYGRIPGIDPDFAISRNTAGWVYLCPALEAKKIPHFVLSEDQPHSRDRFGHGFCLWMALGGKMHSGLMEEILHESHIL